MKIAKKFGQFTQAVGEKFGSSQKTETSEEFKRLQDDTKARRECVERITTPMEKLYRSLSKTKDTAFGHSDNAMLLLAQGMSHYGSVLANDSAYGQNLEKISACESAIAEEQAVFAEGMIGGYMAVLNDSLEGHKEFVKLNAKLENRRLDYDAKLNKVQKTKKENSSLEEETSAARLKYEETLEAMTQKMFDLNSQDDDHHRSLLSFVELQTLHYSKCAELMRNLKQQLESKERITSSALRPASQKIQSQRASKVPTITETIIPTSSPPKFSASQQSLSKSTKRVIVKFDFDAENDNELTIRVGDIIVITQEVDSNWWVGTIEGTGRSGMLPANYTAEIPEENILSSRLPTMLKVEDTRPRSSSQPQASAMLQSDFARNRSASENLNTPTCSQCGCNDYCPHAFKAGCNNCYHVH